MVNLFCFSTLKLEYFAYLSLQPSVYDKGYDIKYHACTQFYSFAFQKKDWS